MHIRPLQPSDFPTVASIAVSGFLNDELFRWTNPYIDQYPEHFRQFFLRKLKSRYWTPGCVIYVIVLDEANVAGLHEGRVIGYAVWERQGESDAAKKWWKATLRMFLESALLRLEENYNTWMRADKSLDYDRLRQYTGADVESFDDIPEIWKLRALCVEPAFQRLGAASKLLEWGKEQASREGCPIGLSSSQVAEAVYLKRGFRRYARILVNGVIEVPVMIWEPEGMEGKWGAKGAAEVSEELET